MIAAARRRTVAAATNYWTVESLSGVAVTAGSGYSSLLSTTKTIAAGDYVGFWGCDVANTDDTETEVRFQIDGSTIEDRLFYPNNAPETAAIAGAFFYTGDGASHSFALDAANNLLGTGTHSNSRLSLLKLGAADAKTENTASFTRSATTFGTANTLTFTPSSNGDYVIVCSFTVDRTSPDPTVQLSDGTTTIEYELTGTNGEGNLWLLPVTGTSGVAKNVTLKIKSNGAGTVGISNRRLLAIRKDRFANVYTARLSSDNSGTQTSFTTGLSQTFTPAAADHLMLAGIIGTGDGQEAWKLDDGGTTVSSVIRSPLRTNTTDALPVTPCHRIAAYAASSRTQSAQRKAISAASTSNIRAGSMIATFDLTGI